MENSSTRLHFVLRRTILPGSLFACAFVLNGCNDPNASTTAPTLGRSARVSASSYVVYVENNVPYADNNAVVAYEWVNEHFVTIPGSPFKTSGKGVANFKQVLGPNDSDQCLAFSADKKRLFAVNSGSNTIAVFNVNADGTLTAVPGSPFPSGGINPVSVGVRDDLLFVVNKNDDPEQPNMGKPNYTTFTIGADGRLTQVPGSTLETVAKASPTQTYVAPNKNLVFGADFLAFMSPTPTGTLRAFTIDAQGKLNASPGTPRVIDGMGGALGLWSHPKENVLYVGFPLEGNIGVYTYDQYTGFLTYKTKVAGGKAVCWMRVNKAGTRLYSLASGENAVTVHDVTNPTAPVELQRLTLKYSGPLYEVPGAGLLTTSEPFYEEFSPDGKYLFVVCQHTNPDLFGTGNYNYLHGLKVEADGRLSESSEPLSLPVAASVRPVGVVVN